MEFEYVGTELELFENAHIWKQYWFDTIYSYTGASILDVGAGTGSTAKLFSNKNLTRYLAVEPDKENIKILREKIETGVLNNAVQSKIGNIGALEEDDFFDTILYIDVLEHIQDDASELESASRHLRPGGRIIVLSPAHQWLYSPFDESVGHFRRYNKESLLRAKPSKLSVERMIYIDSVGILASAANRMILRNKNPNMGQIKLWNDYMVPVSKYLDKYTRYILGKTIVGIFKLPEAVAKNTGIER